MTYRCETHGIELVIGEGRREIRGGSWAGTPQCRLLLMVAPQEGTFGTCMIKRVS